MSKTKAQMAETIKMLEAQRKQQYDRIQELEGLLEQSSFSRDELQRKADNLQERQREVRAQLDALKVEASNLTFERDQLQKDLQDARMEGLDHKKAFLEEQREKRQARELFTRQAHLAGELAKLVTNVSLKNG